MLLGRALFWGGFCQWLGGTALKHIPWNEDGCGVEARSFSLLWPGLSEPPPDAGEGAATVSSA